MEINKLWQIYPDLSEDLDATLTLMKKSIHLSNKDVEHAILKMIHSGGKLLRPAYLILFSQFGTLTDKDRIISLAAAMETLHTATLIHDDIVDEATTRRNQKTIQSQFGKDVAVYAGDYLFVSCFKILAHHASSLKSIQLNAVSMEKILSGELGQMNRRYDTTLSVGEYLTNISGKTAELFSLSCFIGAYENGCTDMFSNKCRRIGNEIGLSFQILDDILDYSQTEEHIGKPVMEDVRQGVYSLPLLYALKENPKAFQPYLSKRQEMTEKDAQAVFQLVHKYGGVESARKLAQTYTSKALKSIEKLPENKFHTKDILYSITDLLLNRTN